MSPHPPRDLLLRPWAESDAEALREAIDENLSHLEPWLGWTLEEPATLEQTRARLRRWTDDFRNGAGFRYAITPDDRTSHILGGANLNCRVGPDAHDVGYWVRKSVTRSGIASAAVARLVVHAFETRGVERLVAQSDPGNEASTALAGALGFEPIADGVSEYADGTPRPVRRLELVRERYFGTVASKVREAAGRVRLVEEREG